MLFYLKITLLKSIQILKIHYKEECENCHKSSVFTIDNSVINVRM